MARGTRKRPTSVSPERGAFPATPSSPDPLAELLSPVTAPWPELPSRVYPSPSLPSRPLVVPPEPFDGRRWHPEGRNRPTPTVRGSAAATGAVQQSLSFLPPTVSFREPTNVVECIRRAKRREVLFASGKGGRGYRKPKRRSWRSNFGCK